MLPETILGGKKRPSQNDLLKQNINQKKINHEKVFFDFHSASHHG